MLDLKELRKDAEGCAASLKRRGFSFDVAEFERLDARRKDADISSQQLLAERKSASKKIGQLVGSGMGVNQAKETVNETLKEIAARLDSAESEARDAQSAIEDMLLGVPNLPESDVPSGLSEDDNQEVSRWGELPNFDAAPKDHVDLGSELGGLDAELAGKITGSRFTVLSGGLARLHRALIGFMLDLHLEAGYTELNVPYIVNRDSLRGTGNLPKFEEDLFKLEGEQGFYLIPTAEVPVTNIARERIYEAQDMPEEGVRFACHTPCFRSEAGSYGRDTRGMIRQHQFEKVELVHFVRPQHSTASLEALTAQAESVLRKLQLPYRKMLLCAGDMGFSAKRTYDLEVWLPGQSKYREISSCSNFGDYQARRMQARWRNPDTGKPELLHTLNGSALAVGRALVAIMENYQQADGSIRIPVALRSYMGGAETIDHS